MKPGHQPRPTRTAFTLMRGYGVRISIYLQDLNQLKQLYPQDWETLVNNAGTIQTFNPSNYQMAKQLADLFGTEVTAEDLPEPVEPTTRKCLASRSSTSRRAGTVGSWNRLPIWTLAAWGGA